MRERLLARSLCSSLVAASLALPALLHAQADTARTPPVFASRTLSLSSRTLQWSLDPRGDSARVVSVPVFPRRIAMTPSPVSLERTHGFECPMPATRVRVESMVPMPVFGSRGPAPDSIGAAEGRSSLPPTPCHNPLDPSPLK